MHPLDAALWLIAIALALAAVWWTLPRPIALDWERLFKLTLVTLVRGEVERGGGDADAWLASGRARVWYHPAGRDAVARLTLPQPPLPQVPARPGEHALVDSLRACADPASRLAALVSGPQDEVLYEDPAAWGPGWDLAAALGQGADWEAVAGWAEPLRAALGRRNERVTWAVLGGEPALAGALVAAGVRAEALDATTPEAVQQALHALTPEPSDRLVLVLVGAGGRLGLDALAADPALRDRVRAVVAAGADLCGGDRAGLERAFQHAELDTELARRVPYLELAFVDPGVEPLGEVGLPLERTVFPRPPPTATGRDTLEVLELGLLPGPRGALGPERLARALLVVVTVRLALE